MNFNRGKMAAAAVLAATLLVVERCDRLWTCTGPEQWGSRLWMMAG